MTDPDLLQVGQQLVVPSVDGVVHTVAPDETLSEIASTFGVDTADLVSANRLEGSADQITVGMVLVVPGARLASRAAAATSAAAQGEARATTTRAPAAAPASSDASGSYTVKDGDTLRSIADAFNLDIVSLMSLNGIGDPDLIRPGSRLRVSGCPRQVRRRRLRHRAPRRGPARRQLLRRQRRDRPPHPRLLPRPRAAAASSPPWSRTTGPARVRAAVGPHPGTTTHWGTVAADTRLFPFGTRLRIQGMGDTLFTVEDTGSAVRGNVFDVWFPDAASARGMGPGNRQVTILGPGD